MSIKKVGKHVEISYLIWCCIKFSYLLALAPFFYLIN